MPATLKRSVEKLVHYLTCSLVVDETSGHDQNVGIVVLTCEVSNLWSPAESGTYALVLVESHGYALSRATHGYARIYLAVFYTLSQSMAISSIIATLRRESAIVFVWDALLIKILLDKLLERKGRVV